MKYNKPNETICQPNILNQSSNEIQQKRPKGTNILKYIVSQIIFLHIL